MNTPALTEDQLRSRFPNASKSVLKMNSTMPGLCAPPDSYPIPAAQPLPPTYPDKSPPSPTRAPKARLRQAQGDGMNKTERAFLAWLKSRYPTARFHREVGLPIANGCRYKPDFMFSCMNGETGLLHVTAYEVKGFMRDDAAVKIKVAASLYPWIKFYLVTRKKGEWLIQRVVP